MPRIAEPNWLEPTLNNFRQNVHGEGIFDAPDLEVQLQAGTVECPDTFVFRIVVRNEGALAVRAGVVVGLYRGRIDDPAPEAIAVLHTIDPLIPGGVAELEYRWPVPAALVGRPIDVFARVDDDDAHNECEEDDNTAVVADVICDSTCPAGVSQPGPEICNDVDDDCDGLVDEGLFRPCHSDCGEGAERCEAGAWIDCSAAAPTPEICDGVDNDCDGEADNRPLADLACPGDDGCVDGVCRQPCRAGECPGDLVCVSGWCVPR